MSAADGELRKSEDAVPSTPSTDQDITRAVDMVLADVRRSNRPVRSVGVLWEGGLDEGAWVVRYVGHELTIDTSYSPADVVVDIAYRLQDDVIDDSGSGWPMSSDGRRLLLPCVDNGSACWCDGDDVGAVIGTLGPR